MHNNHTRTMTEGNIYGHLFHLFLPLIFGNLLQQFYNTIDALVIARYTGNEEFAAAVFSNLLLDIFLVAHLGLGIKGAAQATAFTQLISAVLCLCYLLHAHPEFVLRKEDLKFDKASLNTTFQCSMVTALHQASLYIGKMLVQGTINTGGTFTGTYNGLGKMVLTLAGSTLQIALCVILTWFFFPHFGLAAPAIATGIGWLMANLFWLICLTRLRRQSLLQA